MYSYCQNHVTPLEVTQWTNHRVMEWLRSVDLAEYAPNLRGSGVHGGLMVRDWHISYFAIQIILKYQTYKSMLNNISVARMRSCLCLCNLFCWYIPHGPLQFQKKGNSHCRLSNFSQCYFLFTHLF